VKKINSEEDCEDCQHMVENNLKQRYCYIYEEFIKGCVHFIHSDQKKVRIAELIVAGRLSHEGICKAIYEKHGSEVNNKHLYGTW
jgi:hypothetical protein